MNGIENSQREQLSRDDTAIAWFARLRSPELSSEEQAEFERWVESDPANAAAFAEIEALWDDLGEVADRSAETAVAAIAEPVPIRKRPAFGWLAAAAAIMLALGATAYLTRQSAQLEPQHFSAGMNGPRTVHLEDGSSIYLFKNSAISVVMDDTSRRVQLERGAGVFDVTHDPARGFAVETAHGIVKVVGTVFDVHTSSDQSTIKVISGAVIIGFDENKAGPEFTLNAGVQASYSRNGRTTVSDYDEPTLKFVRTATDQLVFEDVALEAVVSELNEHFKRKLWLGSDDLKRLKVSAVFDLKDEESVLRGIERAIDLEATTVSGNLVVFNAPAAGQGQ